MCSSRPNLDRFPERCFYSVHVINLRKLFVRSVKESAVETMGVAELFIEDGRSREGKALTGLSDRNAPPRLMGGEEHPTSVKAMKMSPHRHA